MSDRPSTGSLIWGQIRYQNKIFWRTPVAAFFTLVFPLMFLLLFSAIFSGDDSGDGRSVGQYFAPNLAVFAAVSASYTNLAIGTAFARDNGILKRVRGTPLPPWIYMAGRVGSATWMAALGVVVMLGVAVVAYGLEIPLRGIPAAVLAFMVGVGCFAALGLLVAAVSPSADATPAITNATLLPIAFVSDVFIPLEDAPRWLQMIGDFFPLKHFLLAFVRPMNPTLEGAQFQWGHLGYMALWGVIATILAVRAFRWEPKERKRRVKRAAADA